MLFAKCSGSWTKFEPELFLTIKKGLLIISEPNHTFKILSATAHNPLLLQQQLC